MSINVVCFSHSSDLYSKIALNKAAILLIIAVQKYLFQKPTVKVSFGEIPVLSNF